MEVIASVLELALPLGPQMGTIDPIPTLNPLLIPLLHLLSDALDNPAEQMFLLWSPLALPHQQWINYQSKYSPAYNISHIHHMVNITLPRPCTASSTPTSTAAPPVDCR